MLPIGSIVYLSEGNQKIMVLNRGPLAEQNGKKVFFDYTGSLYPSGLDVDEVYYFNHDDIDQIIFEGYQDDDEKRFVDLYEKWVKENEGKINKGKTE